MPSNVRPRILCNVDLSMAPEAVATLQEVAELEQIPGESTPGSRRMLLDRVARCDALWTHVDTRIDRELIERAPRLRVINTAATGTDHIDKPLAARRGIRVLCIAKDFRLLDTFTATAECNWMLVLACHRHLRRAIGDSLAARWTGERLSGRQLSGRTLGVLGVGRLGRMTVEYGKAFRMRVLGCDLRPLDIPGVEQVDFDTLLRESDAISIHVHLTDQTRGLLDRQALARARRGVIVTNTSRGDIVDEDAMIEALESGQVAAYGADVIHDEWRPDLNESRLIQYARGHANAVITPHIGGATDFSIRDARVFSAKKLAHFLRTGEELVA